MSKVAIIVPCYNEAQRLNVDSFTEFLSHHPDVDIFFVNDGSSDNTLGVLSAIKNRGHEITIINQAGNSGKAAAVREGLRAAAATGKYRCIGYLDADLSTSLQEFYKLYIRLNEDKADYVLAARIKMLQSSIERSSFRHFAGRVIATIIDSRFQLGIYDTQCGAKCFNTELIELFTNEAFKTKWLFDIEILLRIRQQRPGARGIEMPLSKWKDHGGSKIGILNFPFIVKEILSLFTNYRRK